MMAFPKLLSVTVPDATLPSQSRLSKQVIDAWGTSADKSESNPEIQLKLKLEGYEVEKSQKEEELA